MAFFKQLRKRSKASFRTSDSSNDSNNTVPTQKSTSTLNSTYGGSTPPSSHPTNTSSSNLSSHRLNGDAGIPPVPPRPANSNRNSMLTLSPSTTHLRIPPPSSAFAPRITSILDNSIVYNKILLIHGEIGETQSKPLDGNLAVHHDKDGVSFPSTNWPVSDSYFKALVHLSPGWNKIRFDFTSPKLSSTGSNLVPAHTSYIMINYLPLNSSPPLQLVLLLSRDSPCTFDTTPSRKQSEGDDLALAIRKFRMAAHLWQAFTAEQMYRHKLGRRVFRFEEEWQTGTLSIRDWENGNMKNEAKVHLVRCDKTTKELRDLNQAGKNGDLFSITSEAVKRHFNIQPGQRQFVAALILDTHWEKATNTIAAHAALGGGSDELGLAIFGSHALHTYPTCIEEVVPAFTDCTTTDTNFVANDANESGSSWEAANIGIGAHLHEVGHLFGSPHQESGVMLRDYVHLNRTFCIREPYCTRTRSSGLRVCRMEDECDWHRLDALRFRHHPCFKLPSDDPVSSDESIQYYPLGGGKVCFLAPSGISFVEVHMEGDELCRTWFEFINPDPRNNSLPKQIILTEADIRAKLPEDKRKVKVKLVVFSGANRKVEVDDLNDVLSKNYVVNLPPLRQAPRKDEGLTLNAYNNVMGLGKTFESRQGFKSKKLGDSGLGGSRPIEVILDSAMLLTKLLTSVKVYSGSSLDGLEFCYEDGSSQLFGKRGGKPGGDEFFLDTRRGETILGFHVRAGAWIDGIEILTSSGRRSGVYGNASGGISQTLMAPRGYSLAGLAGTCGDWIDGLQVIITR